VLVSAILLAFEAFVMLWKTPCERGEVKTISVLWMRSWAHLACDVAPSDASFRARDNWGPPKWCADRHRHTRCPEASSGPGEYCRVEEYKDKIQSGDVVYVISDCMVWFLHEFWQSLQHKRIVLVTPDSDWSMPSSVPNWEYFLSDKRIARWFVQNYDMGIGAVGKHNYALLHSKLEPIPIGLDMHTLWHRASYFGSMRGWRAKPTEQQYTLDCIRHTMPLFSQRPPHAYINFWGSDHNHSRAAPFALASELNKEWVTAEGEGVIVTRQTSWLRHGEHAFVISPPGNGLDCYRTWEALALGSVPIVLSSSLDRLFLEHGFPVVIVQSWGEVTQQHLVQWQKERLGVDWVLVGEKLTNRYWASRMRAAAAAVLPDR
jgi:hypothetical protein